MTNEIFIARSIDELPKVATIHELKVWPEYMDALLDNSKTFELRRYDRDFKVGDYLHLREWSFQTLKYSGRECIKKVTYLLRGGHFGLSDGNCIMGLAAGEPITIEQLIAEHPEVVEKIFEAARELPRPNTPVPYITIIDYHYPTATDYINSLKG